MITTRVYIVFYSGRPMDFQKLSDLSGVEPTCIEVKGEERISRITGKVVKIQQRMANGSQESTNTMPSNTICPLHMICTLTDSITN